MRHKNNSKKTGESNIIRIDELLNAAKKKKEVFEVAEKEQVKTEILPIWEEQIKRFYSVEMSKVVLDKIMQKLEPSSRVSVAGLVEQINDVLNILNIAEKMSVSDAEAFYFGYGTSAMERYVKYFEYLSISFYAKELSRAIGKDLRQFYFDDSRKYVPEVRKLEANAERLKRDGTVEMKEKSTGGNQPGE